MLRLALCHSDSQTNQFLFETAMEVLRASTVKCELSRHTGTAKVLDYFCSDKNYYDIYILNAGDPDCMELARKIRSRNLIPAIIFIDPPKELSPLLCCRPSALIGSDDPERLCAALRYCCSEQLHSLTYFTVKNKDSFLRINLDEISFFESRQRLAILHSRKHTVEFYAKLSDIIASLPPNDFIRCHQSYIVNMHKISRLDKANRCFILSSGAVIEISKSNYTQAVAQYTAFLEGK